VIDLRLGRWEGVLAGVEVDAVVVDPPYSARVHESVMNRADTDYHPRSITTSQVNDFDFSHWTADDVGAFVRAWSDRTAGWICALTSHDLGEAWRDHYETAGRYSFAPVPCVITGMTCRLSGDGPSSWAVYAMVARPRTSAFMGGWTNPGAYVVPAGARSDGASAGRGKPALLEHMLVRDYSRTGDLVCDPMAGYGGTLRAAVLQGRRAVGAEVDRVAHRRAMVRSRWLARHMERKERRA
jgi:hypothetical protein